MRHPDKVRENRLRRMAERQGLRLVKSRRRDPLAYDYGLYMFVAAGTDGGGDLAYNLDLDQVERSLTGKEQS